jgi:RNA polymerase sigma-70 factor (ECF subfamily)
VVLEDLDARAEKALRGDRGALDGVLTVLQPVVARYIRARIGSWERPTVSPEDLTQDVMLSVITALPRYRRADGPFIGFVYGIAAHKVSNAFRTMGRDRSAATSDAPELLETAERTSGPEERAIDAVSRRRMDQLLERLPDRQREVLVLRTVVGLSAEEVAQVIDTTPGAVRIAQHRAVRHLRELIVADVAGLQPQLRVRPWVVANARDQG